VCLTTHDIREAEALCDRIGVINRGLVIAVGGTRDIIARSSAPPSVFVATAQPIDPDMLAHMTDISGLVCEGNTTRFHAPHATTAVRQLIAILDARQIEISELHVQKASLEDVFLELTGTRLE
jgi:ABC-2 type transport system ATP-binding protein